jgi:hypothetical protein
MGVRVMRRKAGMTAEPLMQTPGCRVRKSKCRLLKH